MNQNKVQDDSGSMEHVSVIPTSLSKVYRATHILLVRVRAAEKTDWQPRPEGGVKRTVDLVLDLEEVLKGTVPLEPGDRLRIVVTQVGTGTSRIAAVPGVWSNQPVSPGTVFVAFCRGKDDLGAELLRDPYCQALTLADDALDDMRLCLQAERQDLDLAELLELARPTAGELGGVFAQFLWERYGAEALETAEDFERILTFIGLPDLSHMARAVLLDAVYSSVVVTSGRPVERVQRLVTGMFRLLDVTAAEALHGNIIDVFLPNLLGLPTGKEVTTAAETFRASPEELEELRQLLLEYEGPADTGPLLGWLGG